MKLIVSALFLFLVIGCVQKNKSVSKLWFYTHSSGKAGSSLNPMNFLDLQSDGTFTQYFEKFEYGKWSIRHNSLMLEKATGGRELILIEGHGNGELQLAYPNNRNSLLNFEGFKNSFSSPSDNPFSVENNEWRIRPAAAESDIEIKKRLANHFHYFEIYFKWAMENGFTSVDVRSTPSVIKIYGNGFEVKPDDDLPVEWIACFYNKDDCYRASRIVEQLFRKNQISWARTDNKFKMFLSAFQQLQQYLQN